MQPVNRREFLAMAAALPLIQTQSAQGAQNAQTNRLGTTSMFVCMHEASSGRYDFKTAMEGYAKAGIRGVEPDLAQIGMNRRRWIIAGSSSNLDKSAGLKAAHSPVFDGTFCYRLLRSARRRSLTSE